MGKCAQLSQFDEELYKVNSHASFIPSFGEILDFYIIVGVSGLFLSFLFFTNNLCNYIIHIMDKLVFSLEDSLDRFGGGARLRGHVIKLLSLMLALPLSFYGSVNYLFIYLSTFFT